jgi:molecular chaperone GrpE
MAKKKDEANKNTNAQEQAVENQEEFDEQVKGEKTTGKSKKPKKHTKEDEIDELKIHNAELNDKFLRLFSDFDNYRKRTNTEKLDLIKTASKNVIEGMLPVLDDFDRAIQSFHEQNVDEETIKGVELIKNKLFTFLHQKGLEPMDSQGKDFDTDWHDAVTQIPAPSKDMKGKVVDVIQKGYLLNGTIIRHAKVVVGQ